MLRLPRILWRFIVVPLMFIILGTLGYRVLQPDKYDWFDALYMTVITLSTVGYMEVQELSVAGRIFTMFLILGGVFTLFYSAAEIFRIIISGELADALGKQQMEQALANIKNHVIVCGYGRMGRLVCAEFERMKKPFVVVDPDTNVFRDFESQVGVTLVGDATSDHILRRAGIDRAHALVSVMATDADNLFATMSARLLNAKLVIVARVEGAESEAKLLRAGANRVVSPYQIGGTRVAQAVLKPTLVDFIELTTRTEHIELRLEETTIDADSALVGRTLRDSRLMAEHQIIIVAIKKNTGHMIFNPPAHTVLQAEDVLVAIGHVEQLEKLAEMATRKSK